MKKVILFSITAIMLLGALTGCSGKDNVSSDKDGKITEENLVEQATDKLSEMMTTEPTTTEVGGQSEIGDAQTESTEDMSSEVPNGRTRGGIMPR